MPRLPHYQDDVRDRDTFYYLVSNREGLGIFLQISSLTSMKKLKNSLELPNPTRNTRKFANKLMTDTSGELLDLQSKQDIICHVAKVKPPTSAHYVADVIPF